MDGHSAPFWSISTDEALIRTNTSLNGLSTEQVVARQKRQVKKQMHPLLRELLLFLGQFKKPLTLLLLIALLFSAILGEYINASIILVILLLSGVLGFVQERNAGRDFEKLRSLIQAKAQQAAY